jgi:hypothetical protein
MHRLADTNLRAGHLMPYPFFELVVVAVHVRVLLKPINKAHMHLCVRRPRKMLQAWAGARLRFVHAAPVPASLRLWAAAPRGHCAGAALASAHRTGDTTAGQVELRPRSASCGLTALLSRQHLGAQAASAGQVASRSAALAQASLRGWAPASRVSQRQPFGHADAVLFVPQRNPIAPTDRSGMLVFRTSC